MALKEASLQYAVVSYIYNILHPARELVFAIPNQLDQSLKSPRTLTKRAKMGVKAGIPDIFLAYPTNGYHGLFLELKRAGEKPSENQLKWHKRLMEQGYMVVWADNFAAAVKAINSYLDL